MRLLAVVHESPPLTGGGIVCYDLLSELAFRGHETAVFCTLQDPARNEPITKGQLVWNDQIISTFLHTFSPSQNDGMGMRPDLILPSETNDRIMTAFKAAVQTFKPDIVHCFHFFRQSMDILNFCFSEGIPTLMTLLDYYSFCIWFSPFRLQESQYCDSSSNGHRCVSCMKAVYRDWIISNSFDYNGIYSYIQTRRKYALKRLNTATALVSPSRYLVRRYANEWPELAENIHVINHGVPTFHGPIVPYQYHTSNPLTFGYFGGDALAKGLQVVLDSLNYLQDIDIRICFWGPGERLRNPGVYDSRARFFGLCPRKKIPHCIDSVAVVLQPSYSENYSNLVREAFSRGRPVIAADNTGLLEMVTHGVNGLFFKTGDPEDLAKKMLQLAEDRTLLRRLARGAGLTKMRSLADEANDYYVLYSNLLKNKKSVTVA